MNHINIIEGNITQARVDAIVNAANPALLGGGGVDGAIHRAAGPALLEACKRIPVVNGKRCPTGEARITTAGNLAAHYVIHTVGPVYAQADNPAALLASAWRNSMQLALQNDCRTIAFPAISCGVYGYPWREAAEVALGVCGEEAFKPLQIAIYLRNPLMVAIWNEVLDG